MTPQEFKSMVLPTRLLSGEEIISVYSYLAEDEPTRKDIQMKFDTTERNSESRHVDFYAGKEDVTPRSESTSFYPLKLCTSFQVQIMKKLWSNFALKKPVIKAVKVVWPSRKVQHSRMSDQSLNFNVCIKNSSGPLNAQYAKTMFQKNLLNCKDGDEDEITVEPPVELKSGDTYGIIVEDQSKHNSYAIKNGDVYYAYDSGVFSPYDLIPEAGVDLGVVDLTLKEIQKNNWLPGFQYSTAAFPVNVIRGIKVSLV